MNFSSDADAISHLPSQTTITDDGQITPSPKVVEDLRNIRRGTDDAGTQRSNSTWTCARKGKNGPLVRSYASREGILRILGFDLGRQALLRARYAASDAELARDFLINIADPLRYPTRN